MIIHGDSLEKLKDIESESVDLLCTDPPYGYSFMGKAWDKALPNVGIFKECLRVLKPGAFAFVMSAPRSDVCARMMLLLEDAGFNIGFTPIYWTYACLSDDTEVLTENGWLNFNQLRMSKWGAKIAVYEDSGSTWKWESPSAWNITDVHEDLYRIESEETDQLVTGNHRVATSEGIRLAKDLPEQVEVLYVPSMSDGVRDISGRDTKEAENGGDVLFNKLPTESPNTGVAQERETPTQDVGRTETEATRSDDGREELGVEGRGDGLQEEGELQGHQVSSSTGVALADGTEGQVHHGASADCGESPKEASNEERISAPHQPQSNGQPPRESDAVCDEQGTQAVRTRVQSKPTLGRVSRIKYTGMVYCPTVSTGLFLARRNGKVFITGNSGFPKAMNIGKMVDKRAGVEREVVGIDQRYVGMSETAKRAQGSVTHEYSAGWVGDPSKITAPATDQAKALDGSYGGFQPKPAVEVIIVAMKPLSEKTYVDQALKRVQQEENILKDIETRYNIAIER